MSTGSMDLRPIIDSITCPITADIMVDPVQGPDGQTYERSAILHALSIKSESPITRQPMTASDLQVNASIRFLCDKYHSGTFGNIENRSTSPPKLSSYNITLDHSIKKNGDNQLMLEFNVNEESFPKDLTAKDLTTKDLTAKDMTTKDLTAKDLTAKDLTAKDLTVKDLTAKDLTTKDLTVKDLTAKHLSHDIVIVIDRSGSMNCPVEAKDQDGQNLENGLSIQDIVNHAAKTVAKTLDKNSRLAIIAFDYYIDIIFDLMPMTEVNCIHALEKINSIRPRGQTNIWGAVEQAIVILDNRDDRTRNGHIIVLTDGAPNISPARGEVETLQKLRLKKNFTAPIYTFGFGYQLKEGLLYDLAKYANGGNGHIPDGGMIATVFCNFIATILSTVVMNLQLCIEPTKTTAPTKDLLMGDFPCNNDNDADCVTYDLGTVQYQQSRNIVLNNAKGDIFAYYFTYKIGGNSYKSAKFTINDPTIASMEVDHHQIQNHINRYVTVQAIKTMMNFNNKLEWANAIREFNDTVAYLESRSFHSVNLLKNLKGDDSDSGQVKLAVTNPTYYNKWGKFYLDQLRRSLNQQIKPNFKDQACDFGGKIFEEIVDKASDIFDTLAPPEPSLLLAQQDNRAYRGLSSTSNSPAVLPPVRAQTLAAYNSSSNPCFDSKCLITLADGLKKPLLKLQKGDSIQSVDSQGEITTAKIVCVLETCIASRILQMVEFDSGLVITPWHPIKNLEQEWVHPETIRPPTVKPCSSIISLVLDKNHIAFINDIQCITLAHGFTDGILKHSYYGTDLIITDMKKMPGWDNGHVVINDIAELYEDAD